MFLKRNSISAGDDLISVAWRLSLYAFPYVLILSLKISNGVMLALLGIALLDALRKKKWALDVKGFIWCSSLFLLSLLASFYTTNLKEAASDVETRLPLIIFPAVFALKYPDAEELKGLLKHLYCSLGVIFMICLGFALYRNYLDPWGGIWFNQWYYHYTDFTYPVDIHPIYLSPLIVLAMMTLVIDLTGLKSMLNISKGKKVLMLFALMIFLVILGSRTMLVVLVITALMLLVLASKQISRYWFIGFFGFLAIMIFFVVLSPVTRGRFIGAFTSKYDFSTYSMDRLVIWSVALDYVKEHPAEFIIGHGTGTSKQLMNSLYKERNINWDFEQKNSTHNQYLDFLLNIGIVGTLWLLFFLAMSLRTFFLEKKWLGISFIIMMSLGMITENYLNRQKGIVFFGFVYSIIFFSKTTSKTFDTITT